jgi:hypothetical protein
MSPDWNAIRLDLLGIDEPMRVTLRQMRPFFARVLPDILARFYDKVRQYDPSCGILGEDTMRDAIRMQLQHWNLIGGGEFGLAYVSSIARFCELNERAGVAPHWYIGCRPMFVAEQLIRAVETECQIPNNDKEAQAARDRKAAMVKAIAKANMLDTENLMAFYFGANRQTRKDTVAEASDRFRDIIASLMNASSELERTAEISGGTNQTVAASSQLLSSARQLADSTTSLQAEIDGFLKSIAAAA